MGEVRPVLSGECQLSLPDETKVLIDAAITLIANGFEYDAALTVAETILDKAIEVQKERLAYRMQAEIKRRRGY